METKIKDLTLYQRIQAGSVTREECIKLALSNLQRSAQMEIKLKELKSQMPLLALKAKNMSLEADTYKNKSNFFILMAENKDKANEFKELLDEKIVL